MNKEQQVLLSLLKEIDEICKKNEIEYYLAPRLALHAFYEEKLPENPLAGGVLMKLSDMDKFRCAFYKEKAQRRALESMYDNERFPGFFLRYESKDSLCFRMNEGRNYEYPGIGIDIYPLRGKINSRKERFWNQKLEIGWKQFADDRSQEYTWKEKICKIFVGILMLGGRARLGRHLYTRFCNSQNEENAKRYIIRLKNNDSVLYYPAKIFEKTRLVKLEGYSFPVPANIKKYLIIWFGKGYKKKLLEVYSPSLTVITSAYIGCEDFMKNYSQQIKMLSKRRRDQYKRDEKGRKCREYLDWSWQYVKLKGEGTNLGSTYLRKKEFLLNLLQDRDYPTLIKEMKSYDKMMKRYMQNGEVFAPDEEIFQIYLKVLEITGRAGMQDQINQIKK